MQSNVWVRVKLKARLDQINYKGQRIMVVPSEKILEFKGIDETKLKDQDKNKLFTLLWNEKEDIIHVPVQIEDIVCGEAERDLLEKKRAHFPPLSDSAFEDYLSKNKDCENNRSNSFSELDDSEDDTRTIEINNKKQVEPKIGNGQSNSEANKMSQTLQNKIKTLSSVPLTTDSSALAEQKYKQQLELIVKKLKDELLLKNEVIKTKDAEIKVLEERLSKSELRVEFLEEQNSKILSSLNRSPARRNLFQASTPKKDNEKKTVDQYSDFDDKREKDMNQELLEYVGNVTPIRPVSNDDQFEPFEREESSDKSQPTNVDFGEKKHQSPSDSNLSKKRKKSGKGNNNHDVSEEKQEAKKKKKSKRSKKNKAKKVKKTEDSDEEYESDQYQDYKEKENMTSWTEEIDGKKVKMMHLFGGIHITNEAWRTIKDTKSTRPKLFLKSLSKAIWGSHNLMNRAFDLKRTSTTLPDRSPRKKLTPRKKYVVRKMYYAFLDKNNVRSKKKLKHSWKTDLGDYISYLRKIEMKSKDSTSASSSSSSSDDTE